MKKFFKTSATLLFIGFAANVNAQNGNGTTSATTDLTVNVGELFSIIVDQNATINLDTQEKFIEGAKSAPTSMTVFATRGYNINAITSSDKFSSTGDLAAYELPLVNNVSIEINKKGEASATPRISALANTSQVVLDSDRGAKNMEFDVVYAIPAANTEAFLAAGGETLTTTITYTITGK